MKKFYFKKLITIVLVVAISLIPSLALISCSEEQGGETSVATKPVALNGWIVSRGEVSLSMEGNVVTVEPSADGDASVAAYPSLSTEHRYLNLSAESENAMTATVAVKYVGVKNGYVSTVALTGGKVKSSVILNVNMTVESVTITFNGLKAGKSVTFSLTADTAVSGAIVSNEESLSQRSAAEDGSFADGGQSPYTDNGSQSGQPTQSEQSSQGGQPSHSGSQSSQGGQSASQGGGQSSQGGQSQSELPSFSEPGTDPYTEDPFFFNYIENPALPQDSGTSVQPSAPVYEQPVPVDYNGTILAEKYEPYFNIGMTAGYERYDKYNAVSEHFNSFTCENEMKMYTIASDDNEDFDYNDISTYDFSKADEMLVYMRAAGKKIRGHCLLWHYECPKWLTSINDKATLLNAVDKYCYNVVKHFSEKFSDVIYAWDVVNEAVSDNFSGGIRLSQTTRDVFGFNVYENGCNEMRSFLYKVAGYDYIVTAFKAARRADGNVKLYYNDYDLCLEHQKLRGVVNMLNEVISLGAPIDGVGFESHFKSPYSTANAVSGIEKAVSAVKKLAEIKKVRLEVQVTELDVENNSNNNTALASFYGSVFETYRAHADIISAVVFWGVADDYSWLDHGEYNKAYPFLFDASLQKKAAFDAVFGF